MRTETQFYNDHLTDIIDLLYTRITEIENQPNLSDQDDIELSAIDKLLLGLDRLY